MAKRPMADVTNTTTETKEKKRKVTVSSFPIYQVTGGEITANIVVCDVLVTDKEIRQMFKIIHHQMCELGWVVGSQMCIYMWTTKTGVCTFITTSDDDRAERLGDVIKDAKKTKEVVVDLLIRNSTSLMRTVIATPTKQPAFKLSSHLRKNDVGPIIQRVMT